MHLDTDTKRMLLRFVCAVAWTDFQIDRRERLRLIDLINRLGLDDAVDEAELAQLLSSPPEAADIDPMDIPAAARSLFLSECRAMAAADGVLQEEEREMLTLLTDLLHPTPEV